MNAQAILDDSERVYREGYLARSIDDCPYPEAGTGPWVMWTQGYHQHQRDRERIAAAAAHPWCRNPRDPLRL